MNMHPMLRSVITVAILLTEAAPAMAQIPFADSYADDIASLLSKHFSDGDGAMVIGLVDEHGSRIFSGGTLDNGTDAEVNGDTIFEIGSVTKVFTSLLLLESARRGELEADDPVAKHLPEGVRVPSFEGTDISLLHLAVQDSGLPWHPHYVADHDRKLTLPELRDAANAYTLDDMHAFLANFKLSRAPGEAFQYSNVGMALLGHALEHRTGIDYESLVVDRICRPLKMESTCVSLDSDQKKRLARGHWADGTPGENVKFQAMRPAGSLVSTGNDLLKFVSANLGFGDSQLSALMKQTQIIRHSNHPRFGKTAMPWFDERVYNPPGKFILAHGGGGFGYLAFIGLETSERRGAVVLTSQMSVSPYGIGWTLLQGMPLTHENITYWVREIVALGFALETEEETGRPRIKTVWPESPAGKAGLQEGTVILKINGTGVDGKSLQECLTMMSGPRGTKVRLEILDTNQQTSRDVELVREMFLTATGQSRGD